MRVAASPTADGTGVKTHPVTDGVKNTTIAMNERVDGKAALLSPRLLE